MKIGCIIQARTGSTRLPNKILMKIAGKEMLIHIAERILNSKRIDHIVVATTDREDDNAVEELIIKYNNPKVKIFRGSEKDVLDRYYQAAKKNNFDVIIRLTGDCPLMDWEIIGDMIEQFVNGDYDYVSNVLKRTFPRGLDTEIFTFKVLKKLWENRRSENEKEHVTTYIRENPFLFKTKNIEQKDDLSRLRWTVDEMPDFIFIKKIYDELYKENNKFKTNDILELLAKKPELTRINSHIRQKESIKNEAN